MIWPAHDPDLIRAFAARFAERQSWVLRSCEPWKEGASNAIWALETGQGRFILKIGKLEYWRRLSVEGEVLRFLNGEDAPRLIDTGSAGPELPWDWSVLERVEGTHLFRLCEEDAFELGRMMARIRVKTAGLELESGRWRSYLENRILNAVELARKGMIEPVAEIFAAQLENVEKYRAFGELLDSLPTGICHGDLTPYNLIKKTGGGFSLLDWEHPRRASAAFDLATIRKAFRMSPEEFAALRRGWGEEVPEGALAFADALYQLHVSSWRAEMWYGRNKRDYGDFFLIELGEELGRVEVLFRSLAGFEPTA